MQTSRLTYVVTEHTEHMTIKEILKQELHLSDRLISRLKNHKSILFNGENIFVDRYLKAGDKLVLVMEEEGENEILPQPVPLHIVYEDEVLIVVDKAAGIVVHPSQLHPDWTLANGVIHHFCNNGLDIKFRAVHRIDRDTSGLLVIAKNQYIHHQLSMQLEAREIERKYLAIAQGVIQYESGKINAPIGRAEESIIERRVDLSGKHAVTYFKVIQRLNQMTLIELQLETGRTHQIRVHMKNIGHPLVGDGLYGQEHPMMKRQALHAHILGFIHPLTKQRMRFVSPLPKDMEELK